MSARRDSREQVDDAYRAIGRYVVEFSRLVLVMRTAIARALSPPGETSNAVEMLIGEQTADPITNAFFKLCEIKGELDEAEKKVANCLRNRVRKQISLRNDFAHGDWWIGVTIRPTGTTVQPRLSRIKTSRSGVFSETGWSATEMDERSESIIQLRQHVAEFGYLALGIESLSKVILETAAEGPLEDIRVSDVFVLKKDEVVRDGPLASRVPQVFHR